MASDWMMNQVKSTLGGSPTAVPPVKLPVQVKQPTKTTVQPTQPTQTTSPNNPHGQLFSGNLIQKAFDIPRLIEYGAASFSKGGIEEKKRQIQTGEVDTKSYLENIKNRVVAGVKNIIPGVQNRTQYGREAGDYNAAEALGIKGEGGQTAYNLATSLAMPSLPVGKVLSPIAKGITKIPGVQKAGQAVSQFAKETPVIAKTVEKVNPFFRNPEMGKMVQTAEEGTQSRLNQVYKMVTDASKGLSPSEQKRVGQLLEGGIVTDPNNKYYKIAKPIADYAEQVGKEAVDLGLLSPESFAKYKGKYMSHIWTEMGKSGEVVGFAKKSVPTISGQFFKQRKGAEGYVKEFAPAVMKGLGTESKDIEVAKLYKGIAEKFGVNANDVGNLTNPEKFAYAPEAIVNSKTGKYFKDMVLPVDVVDKLNELVKTNPRNWYDKLYDLWKKGKTIYNPAYHVRNVMSNQVLSDMSTGEGLPSTVANYAKNLPEYFGKGDQKFVDAAKSTGLIGRENFGSMFNKTLEGAGLTDKGNKIIEGVKKADRGVTKLQNVSEETAKLNVFKSWLSKLADEAKITVDEALKNPDILKAAKDKAEEAIFSPYRISPTERSLASKVVPFYLFTRQAAPFTAKTYLNNPERLTKYDKIKTAVEGLTPEGAKNKLPPERQGQIRIPVKDKEGNYAYYDPTYTLPYGNFGDFSGEGGRLPLGLSIRPDVTELFQQMANKDFYFDQPIAKSNVPEKAKGQRIEHAARTFAPQLYTTLKGKVIPALTGQPDYAGRERGKIMAILDAAGIKTSIFRPQEQAKWDTIDKQSKLKSINNEKRSLIKNKSISPEDKRVYMQELNKVYSDTLRGN